MAENRLTLEDIDLEKVIEEAAEGSVSRGADLGKALKKNDESKAKQIIKEMTDRVLNKEPSEYGDKIETTRYKFLILFPLYNTLKGIYKSTFNKDYEDQNVETFLSECVRESNSFLGEQKEGN